MNTEPFAINCRLLLRAIDACLSAVVSKVGELSSSRLGRVKVVLCTALLSLLVSFPHYGLLRTLDNDVNIQALMIKFHNPLSPIPPELKNISIYDGFASHNDKLELRLTLPVLGWLSGTGKWTVVIWNHVSALGVFYLLAKLGSEALGDEVGGALFVLAIGPTYFGSWFFSDYIFGDGIAFLLLLLSVASRNLLFASLCFFAAAFADERCVAAIPLLLLYFAVSLGRDEQKTLRLKHSIAILIGAGTWLLVRFWVAHTYHLSMGTSGLGDRWLIRQNLMDSLPHVLPTVFKMAWTLPLFAVMCLLLQRRWLASSAFISALVVALLPAFLVFDFDRSACYAFTILLTSLYFFRSDNLRVRKCLAAILILNVLWHSPAHSILRLATRW
jgi:hypothetical protein